MATDPSTLFASESPTPIATEFVASGFVLLAATCVALGSVLMQRIESDISTEGTVAWSCVFGALFLHLLSFGLPTESFAQTELTVGAVIAVVYLSIFASALGYFIYFDLLGRVGAIEINLVSYATPLVATLFGWLLLNETITVQTVVGFLVIAFGFALLKRDALATQFELVRSRTW